MPHDASLPIYDPNEQFNRGVLHVNQVVLDPPATVVKSVPGVIRDRFQDLDANLKEPRVLANNILQGRFNAAGITIGRIIFNTTFGLGGLFDVAARRIAAADRRFRPDHVRLGRSGGHLHGVARISVPRRNAIRSAASWIRSAIPSAGSWAEFSLDGRGHSGRAALSAVAHLGQWKQAESSSVDFYSFLRSSYYQTRRAQLREAQGLPPQIESPATPRPRSSGRRPR